MRKQKRLLVSLLAVTILSSLVIMSGCGTEEEKTKTKTSSVGDEAVNSIKESKLENYQVNIKNKYVHETSSFGFSLKFEVTLDDMEPSYEAYVCNDMSSLVDKKVQEENAESYNDIIEKNPNYSDEEINEAWNSVYKTIYYMNVSYAAGKSVEIEWVPYATEDNASKFSSEEEYLKTGNMYLVLKEKENIIGFMVFEFPVGTSGENNAVSYEEVNVLEAVAFEKIDGKYQDISLEYVKSRVDNILENR